MTTNLNNIEMSTIAMYNKEGGDKLGDKAAVALYYFSELVKHCKPTIYCHRQATHSRVGTDNLATDSRGAYRQQPRAIDLVVNSITWTLGIHPDHPQVNQFTHHLDPVLRHYIQMGDLTFSSKVYEGTVSVPVLMVGDEILLEFHLGYSNEYHHWTGWQFASGLNSVVFVQYDGWNDRDDAYFTASLIPNLTDPQLSSQANLLRNAYKYIQLQRQPIRTITLMMRFYAQYQDKYPTPEDVMALPVENGLVSDLLAYLSNLIRWGNAEEQASAAENYQYIQRLTSPRYLSGYSSVVPTLMLCPAQVDEDVLSSTYYRKVRYNKATGERLGNHICAAVDDLEIRAEFVKIPLKLFKREAQELFKRELL
jgi:hypothetical protein